VEHIIDEELHPDRLAGVGERRMEDRRLTLLQVGVVRDLHHPDVPPLVRGAETLADRYQVGIVGSHLIQLLHHLIPGVEAAHRAKAEAGVECLSLPE
jgi:hypothetical protein